MRLAARYQGVFAPTALAQSERYVDSLSHTGRHSAMMTYVLDKAVAGGALTPQQILMLR